jgi:hypothetical protein
MNTFVHAVDNQLTTTENGMPAFVSTTNASVDFFFKSGASRGKNIIPTFIASFVEDQDLAVRIALWLRDVRQGSGGSVTVDMKNKEFVFDVKKGGKRVKSTVLTEETPLTAK